MLFVFFAVDYSRAEYENRMIKGSFTNEVGTRAYELFMPSKFNEKKVPLVVMLHGCTQNANDFSLGTEMNAMAEKEGFFVLYPEQSSEFNANKCWNWFEVGHQQRGKGEPSIIAEMTLDIVNKYPINSKKVYVAGMSAGGAMSVIMGATYPDVYAAIGVSAGLEYKAGTDLLSGTLAMQVGGPDPARQGRLAYEAMQQFKRTVPMIVFHGDSDVTVNVTNGHQVLSQWSVTNDYADDGFLNKSISDTHYYNIHDQVENGFTYTQSTYFDSSQKPIMEKWIVHGMSHKWSGGNPNGSYTDPKGPKATREMVRFFNQFMMK
jgi:poly(hydroxyalkanoate) depolymerase family esterase